MHSHSITMPHDGHGAKHYDATRGRRSRYRSSSEESDDSRRSYQYREKARAYRQRKERKQDNFGRASIAVGILSIVAGLIQLWMSRASMEGESHLQSQRRREFEKRKLARRERETISEQQADREDAEWELRRHAIRQIEPGPQERSRSRLRLCGRTEVSPPPSPGHSRSCAKDGRGREIERRPR